MEIHTQHDNKKCMSTQSLIDTNGVQRKKSRLSESVMTFYSTIDETGNP